MNSQTTTNFSFGRYLVPMAFYLTSSKRDGHRSPHLYSRKMLISRYFLHKQLNCYANIIYLWFRSIHAHRKGMGLFVPRKDRGQLMIPDISRFDSLRSGCVQISPVCQHNSVSIEGLNKDHVVSV